MIGPVLIYFGEYKWNNRNSNITTTTAEATPTTEATSVAIMAQTILAQVSAQVSVHWPSAVLFDPLVRCTCKHIFEDGMETGERPAIGERRFPSGFGSRAELLRSFFSSSRNKTQKWQEWQCKGCGLENYLDWKAY